MYKNSSRINHCFTLEFPGSFVESCFIYDMIQVGLLTHASVLFTQPIE